MRGWAASPDVLGTLVDEFLARRPELVVECGSGVSTLWLALAARDAEIPTRIVSLDHEPDFLESTRATLDHHGVADVVDLRLAPLVPTTIPGHSTRWYDVSALDGLSDIGLVFVDGPPELTGPQARFPALPLLHPLLAERTAILLDDASRNDEAAIVAQWLEDYPEFTARPVSAEKGAVLLERHDTRSRA
jgi:predicted O-methyltransferase YrrM